ncbi:MAG: hypothetical protein LBH31_03480 [Burkholderiaceae bacterium]|jgi:hypothetical protein|nr:hypothetical protein [Burkholderiaceae bacterium]
MTSSSDPLAFAQLIPGFDVMQQFAQAAASAAGSAPGFAGWIAPTVSIEELDKRIAELKAVQFWLEQNLLAIRATTQALEVQKMTLAALQSMNLNLPDIAQTFTAPTEATDETAAAAREPLRQDRSQDVRPATATGTAPSPAEAAAASNTPDPLQWWGALTRQFQSIAASALREAASAASLAGQVGTADAAADEVKARPADTATPNQPARAQSATKPAAKSTPPRAAKKQSATGSRRSAG